MITDEVFGPYVHKGEIKESEPAPSTGGSIQTSKFALHPDSSTCKAEGLFVGSGDKSLYTVVNVEFIAEPPTNTYMSVDIDFSTISGYVPQDAYDCIIGGVSLNGGGDDDGHYTVYGTNVDFSRGTFTLWWYLSKTGTASLKNCYLTFVLVPKVRNI